MSGRLPVPAGMRGEVLEDLQILLDLLDNARPAHLDHDLRAVVQRRGVRLPDRGGGQRGEVKARKRLLGNPAESPPRRARARRDRARRTHDQGKAAA